MEFKKLLSILSEANEPIEEYDDWTNWIDYNDTDITLEEFHALVNKFQLQKQHIIKNRIVKLHDESNTRYLEFFPEHNTFDKWADDDEDVEDTIIRMQEADILDLLSISEEDVWIDVWECSIKDARENPGTVYHYTTEEKWEEIQKHGGLIPSYGSGLSNRSAYGVFTTIDAEELAIGTYGDVCLEINLSSLLKDTGEVALDLSPEPEVLEVELQKLLLNKFGIESRLEASQDMSPFTMIINHFIPLKYITAHEN